MLPKISKIIDNWGPRPVTFQWEQNGKTAQKASDTLILHCSSRSPRQWGLNHFCLRRVVFVQLLQVQNLNIVLSQKVVKWSLEFRDKQSLKYSLQLVASRPINYGSCKSREREALLCPSKKNSTSLRRTKLSRVAQGSESMFTLVALKDSLAIFRNVGRVCAKAESFPLRSYVNENGNTLSAMWGDTNYPNVKLDHLKSPCGFLGLMCFTGCAGSPCKSVHICWE